jgi:hypothetical protein
MKKMILVLMLLFSVGAAAATEDTINTELNELLVNSQTALMNQEGTMNFNVQLNIDNSPYGLYVVNDQVTIKEGIVKEPYMVIDTTEEDLETTNKLLTSYNEDGKLSIFEKMTLWKLMLEYNLSDDIVVYVDNELSGNLKMW